MGMLLLSRFWFLSCIWCGVFFVAHAAWGVTFIESPNLSFSDVEVKAVFDMMSVNTRYRAAQTPEKVRGALTDIFMKGLIAKEAERMGLDAEPVNSARLQHVRQSELARIALERKRQELRAKSKLLDFSKQAQEVYQAHPEEFVIPEQVDVGHILFRSSPCEKPEVLRAKAQAVRERLLSGESFEDLARKLSDDQGSASQGGRLGFQQRDTFVPAFGSAAFALQEVGQVSDIVETSAGFHLIRLYAHQPASKQSFEDVEPGIVERLAKDYIQREIDQWRQSLWDAKSPRVDDQAIEAFTKELRDSFPKLNLPDN